MEQVDSVMPQKSSQSSPQKSQSNPSPQPTAIKQPKRALQSVPQNPQPNQPQLQSSKDSSTPNPKRPPADVGLCPLCRKTQLARGCGHKCGFCLTLFCSRCGGKAQVKNEDTTGKVWVCNVCRRKPPNQRRINERFIEPLNLSGSKPGSSASGRLSSQSNTSSNMTNHQLNSDQLPTEKDSTIGTAQVAPARPSLTRQTSERERDQPNRTNDKSNFRISPRTDGFGNVQSPVKSSTPKQIPNQMISLRSGGSNQKHIQSKSDYLVTGKAKRSPPLGELDSGVASLSIEDPSIGPNGVDSLARPGHEKNIIFEEKVENDASRSSTLPERSKTRPKRRYLPRHPSLTDNDSSIHGVAPTKPEKSQKTSYYRSQPDLRSSPPRPGVAPFDSSSDEWHRRSFETDCQSEASSCSGYWDLDTAAVLLKLWWENLAETCDGEGRLVSAIERVSAVSHNMGPPAIRLCLVHPGRGRAARRRTAASAADAIETRDGGWCWTSQTAIGWGPLPKRALSRLALEISLCDDQRNVLSRALVGLLDLPFDARPRWYRLHPWSSSHSISRIEDSELRPEYRRSRPRRKLPALPRVVSSLSNQMVSHGGSTSAQLTPPTTRTNNTTADVVPNRAASETGHNNTNAPRTPPLYPLTLKPVLPNFTKAREFKGRLEHVQRASLDSEVEYPLNESDELNSYENISVDFNIIHRIAYTKTKYFPNLMSPAHPVCQTQTQSYPILRIGPSLHEIRTQVDNTPNIYCDRLCFAQANQPPVRVSDFGSSSSATKSDERSYTPLVKSGRMPGDTAVRPLPTSSSTSVVQGAPTDPMRRAGIPTHSSQPALLSSNPLLSREPSRESEDGSSNSGVEPSRLLADFVGGLGPGQVAGRQALGAGSLGELQITLQERQRSLIISIMQARSLKAPRANKSLPAPYIKLYLMFGARCVSKSRTPKGAKTLSPHFQHIVTFNQSDVAGYDALQAIVWADYGPLDNKAFMGVAQVQHPSYKIQGLLGQSGLRGKIGTVGWMMGNEQSISQSQELIVAAVRDGDFCALATFIAENEKIVRSSDESGRTLLWATAHYNRPGMTSLLINHKAKLNQSGGADLTTPLQEAALHGHIDIVQLLCEQGAVLDVEDFHGNTAMMYAARNKHTEVCSYLAARGAKIHSKNNENQSIVDMKFGKSEINRFFQDYVPMLTNNPSSSLLFAASKNDFSIARGLLRAGIGANVRDENGKSVWFYVAAGNCLQTAKRLRMIDANSASYLNHSPLVEAVKLGNREMVELLLECDGTNIKEVIGDQQNSILHIAASYGHNNLLQLLVEKGVTIHSRNISNQTVWAVAKYRSRQTVKSLMDEFPESDIDISRRTLTEMAENRDWRTLITQLTKLRREDKLVESLSPPSGDGRGVLWWASFHGSIEVVRFVASLAKNFDVTQIIDGAGGDEFTTPLWNAAKFGHYDILKLLHEHGANFNAKDKHGNTPLHTATKNAHWEIMTFLVTAGCDFEAKNNNGKQPVDMAGWKFQTRNVLRSIIQTEQMKREHIKGRRRSADDTASSLFGVMNSLQRLQLNMEDKVKVPRRRHSEMEHLRELLTDLEEDINTESSLRELVNDVKFSLDDDEKDHQNHIEKPMKNLKKYLENVVENNSSTDTEGFVENSDHAEKTDAESLPVASEPVAIESVASEPSLT